jgi:LysM repeat protein
LLVTEILPLLAIMLIPASVHAGVFSSLAQIWSDQESEVEVVETVDHSALYTPLLSASVSPLSNIKKATGGGDVTVSDGALISTGPVGPDQIAESNTGTDEISVYVVREGDALSQIAEMYNVTTNTILWANDISKASDIHPGDTLVILPIIGVKHEVKKGQTLASIVKKYEADFDEVLEYNNLASADDLSVGDELMIPGGQLHAKKSVATTKRATPTKSTGSASGGGNFVHPAPGATRTQGIHGNNAVDLAAGYGSPIRAAGSGKVIISKAGGWNGGYGTYIVIRHSNGTQTLYAHLSTNNVVVGQYVSAGQVIGGMGSTGKSTGTHLHFEVRGGRNPF